MEGSPVFGVPLGSISNSSVSSCRDGLMLQTNRHDEELTGPQLDFAPRQSNRQAALENQEEVVRVFVVVPDEFALDLDDHDVVPVELGNCPRRPVLVEQRQLLFEVDDL